MLINIEGMGRGGATSSSLVRQAIRVYFARTGRSSCIMSSFGNEGVMQLTSAHGPSEDEPLTHSGHLLLGWSYTAVGDER